MNSIFERCYDCGDRITDKVERLSEELTSNPPPFFDGLNMTLCHGVKPITEVLMPNGKSKEMLMLGSNSFLNLNHHPRILEAERRCAEVFGVGAGSPPLYAGTTTLHRQLEEKLAKFCQTEDAIIFPAGYSGNIGVLSALLRPQDRVYMDSSNHASLFDGARLSGAKIVPYLHLNSRHLAKIIEPNSMIVTDGVFSMEGTIAPIDRLVELKKAYNGLLMVDDAHGFWAIGEQGGGSASTFGALQEVDIHYGTFSKALGYVGGFAAAKREIIEYLRFYARSTFFSSALSATTIAGVMEAMDMVVDEPIHLQSLHRNRDFFQKALEAKGFNTLNSRSAIIPVLVGDDNKLGLLQSALFNHGIFTNIGTTPAVSAKKCRLRLNVMATHTIEQLSYAVDVIVKLGQEFGVI